MMVKQTKKKNTKLTPAALARHGNLQALSALENNRDAYKWLCAAGDFGHDDADDYISDLLEVSSLRFDDSRFETAAAHWELAIAYLEGADGLPCDLDLAAAHLEKAFENHRTPEAISAGTSGDFATEPLLARLSEPARAVLNAGLAGNHFTRARRAIDDLRHLVQLGHVPTVIIAATQLRVRRIVAELCPLPTPESVGGDEPLDAEVEFLEHTLASTQAALTALIAERERRKQTPPRPTS